MKSAKLDNKKCANGGSILFCFSCVGPEGTAEEAGGDEILGTPQTTRLCYLNIRRY